jgi:hypothetical protein
MKQGERTLKSYEMMVMQTRANMRFEHTACLLATEILCNPDKKIELLSESKEHTDRLLKRVNEILTKLTK